jgi:crotonobetainyl-CoA:carnitine CoA-transferase CaiB-like acyl-CoA transferase
LFEEQIATEEIPVMPTSLSGVRVIDLTVNVAGPFATQILGDLGANVIKVERPGTGDDTRAWGPPFWGDEKIGVSFLTLNRNKRSIVVDLKTSAGLAQLEALVASADVLVQNLRPGALARIGLTEERLREINPRLVYCEISGFGADGPRAEEPAFDSLMQAFSGLMSITGDDAGSPARIPVSVLDKGTALWAVIAVLNALRLRDQADEFVTVRTSLLETALAWQPLQVLGYLATGDIPRRLGSGIAGIAPYQAFRARDRHLVIAAANDRLFVKLCDVLETPELLEDDRFSVNTKRFQNKAALTALIEEQLSGKTVDEWLVLCRQAGVPAAAINDVAHTLEEPQVQSIGMIEHHADGDAPSYVHTPISTNGVRFPTTLQPPALGQDTEAVLKEIEDVTVVAERGTA